MVRKSPPHTFDLNKEVKMKKISFVLFMAGILLFISCGKKAEEPAPAVQETAELKESAEFQEPDHLTIQHILISFQVCAQDDRCYQDTGGSTRIG